MKIAIKGLVKRYKGKKALDGISLTVRPGEIFGFIGPNGAGKTTTMSILTGLLGFDAGTCEIDGKAPGKAGGRDLGYLPEEPVFAEFLTGREYLSMLARSMGLPRPETELDSLLERVSLAEASKRRVSGYSRGMRQRLGLACALLGDPGLLVLDEPSSALDPEGRKAVVDLVLGLKAEGKTVFLSTHILSDIERICDRIALIDRGRILLEGSVAELLDEGSTNRVDLSLSRPFAEAERQALARLPSVRSLEGAAGSPSLSLLAVAGDADGFRVALGRKIGELGLPLLSLSPRKPTLEELFLEKVARHA